MGKVGDGFLQTADARNYFKRSVSLNKKTHIFLVIVLAVNTLRYGTYLSEGDANIYYIIMFLANLIAMLFVIISRMNKKRSETDSSIRESR